MRERVWQSTWFWAAALVIGGLVGIYYAVEVVNYAVVGRPTTPMTPARAGRLFGQALRTDQSRAEVEAWLTSQGIPRGSVGTDKGISFDVLHRPVDEPVAGFWMGGRGHRTVAECAGLENASVASEIRICYPDADRFLLGQTRITVFLFFDSRDRLLRHWVDEFHLMP